jgi:rubrerythrin
MAPFTAAQGLEMAMQIEQNGELFYTTIAGETSVTEVKELFEFLAAQERNHYKVFEKLLGRVAAGPQLVAPEQDEYALYLNAALDQALFSGPDKALAKARDAQDRETAVRTALGFEKDTLLFFYDLREMVGDADRETLTRIVNEEKAHVRRLAKEL